MSRALYVNCTPGLGNQLFQYAAGLYYAQRWKAALAVLPPAPEHCQSQGHPRPFQLDRFRITRPVLPVSRYHRFVQTSQLAGAAKALRSMTAKATGTAVVKEDALYHFYDKLAPPPEARAIYLRGYWQAWQYAATVEQQLRAEFVLIAPPTGRNAEYADRIAQAATPVSIHLRRGDYTTFTSGTGTTARGLVLDVAFYHRALAHLREVLGEGITPFIFSDDIAFARDAIQHPNAIYVEGNDAFTAYEDLRLMSLCSHHIIANSTFSWWGAWLGANPAKIVIAPKYWTNQIDSFYPDLLPPTWTAMDNLHF